MIVRQKLAGRKTRNSKSKERKVEERGRHLKTGGLQSNIPLSVVPLSFFSPVTDCLMPSHPFMDFNSFEEDEDDGKAANAHRERSTSRKVLQTKQVRSFRGEHLSPGDSSLPCPCAVNYCIFLNPLKAILLCYINSCRKNPTLLSTKHFSASYPQQIAGCGL